MGTLDFYTDQYHLWKIRQKLKRRGLRMDPDDEWEIHGPHPNMNYQVYVGYAYFAVHPHPLEDTRLPQELRIDGIWVTVTPRAVYQIEDASSWYDTKPESRIETI